MSERANDAAAAVRAAEELLEVVQAQSGVLDGPDPAALGDLMALRESIVWKLQAASTPQAIAAAEPWVRSRLVQLLGAIESADADFAAELAARRSAVMTELSKMAPRRPPTPPTARFTEQVA